MAYAHSRNEEGEYHDLVDHLRATAAKAREFSAAFDAGDAGYYLGLWHDLGKFHPEWQQYLLDSEAGKRKRGGPDHKAAGASIAARAASPLAFAIAGHHGGLPASDASRASASYRGLRSLLFENTERIEEAIRRATEADTVLDPTASILLPGHVGDERAVDLFVRMLFSALVDADFLDTEAHFRAADSLLRSGGPFELDRLFERLQQNQEEVFAGPDDSEVNRSRAEIYRACLAAAERPPGFFRLNVPTGGGKTRSGLAFGLRHAALHGLERVIVAVPFISITEQTAATYRGIFDVSGSATPVLEHHSAIAEFPGAEMDERPTGQILWSRLAAENWDAPIIVTTTVQLFESLFARSPSKMRKLHRLAGSVIILDEAQALPPRLLEPILDALRGLVRGYGASVVFSTATQPAFDEIRYFRQVEADEIVRDSTRYFTELERVEYDLRLDRTTSWEALARELAGLEQALVILNTRPDALRLLDAFAAWGVDDVAHLSTLLCGAHRRDVIREIAERLRAGDPCRLISTQVVEAGVDLDFPVVYRAFGPLDSIVQAAGRCNREGLLERGRTIVFEPEDGGMPTGWYRTATDDARIVLRASPGRPPDDPEVLRRYFELLYQDVDTDAAGIQSLRAEFDFPAVAERFRIIDDETVPAVVTAYGDAGHRERLLDALARLRRGDPESRLLLRRLQPYTVALRRHAWDEAIRNGSVVEVLPGLGEWRGNYDPVRGIGQVELMV